jgi:small subunit ribosomal protein S17
MRKKKGTITSTKMTGTVTVTVDSLAFHPKYKKRYKVSKKFLADLAGHEVNEGDLVIIGECRPLSKRKHFKIVEVVKKATAVEEVATEADVEKAIHREKVAPPESVKKAEEVEKPKEEVTEEKTSEDEKEESTEDDSSPKES